MAERTRLTGGRCLCLAGAETWTAPVFSKTTNEVDSQKKKTLTTHFAPFRRRGDGAQQ